MFKVGDRIKIRKPDGSLYDENYIITYSTKIGYTIKEIQSDQRFWNTGKRFEYDKQYYRKEKINKILECLK